LEPRWLELEITEGMVIQNTDGVVIKLEELRKKAQIYDNEKCIMKSFGMDKIESHNALGDVISLKALVDYLLTLYTMDDLIKIGKYVKKK
jgi:hypothetical protein